VSEATAPKKKGLSFGKNFKNKSDVVQKSIVPTQTKAVPTQIPPPTRPLPTKETNTAVRQYEPIHYMPQVKNSKYPPNSQPTRQKIADPKEPMKHVQPEPIQQSHPKDMDESKKSERNEVKVFMRSDSVTTIHPEAIDAIDFPKSSLRTDEEVLRLIKSYFNSPIDNIKIGPTLKLRQDLARMFIEPCIKPE